MSDQETKYNIASFLSFSSVVLGRDIAVSHFISVPFLFGISPADNHTMASYSPVSIRILDVNDNPPELATPYEASICEDAKPGQVWL